MPKITLVILAFKSSNEQGLVAYTIVFTCPYKKNVMESNLANVEACHRLCLGILRDQLSKVTRIPALKQSCV